MSENYEITEKQIKYTNSEYPGVEIINRKYRNETISKKRVKQKFHTYIGVQKQGDIAFTANVEDSLWMGGSKIRTDYNIASTEGQRIKGILDSRFSGRAYDGTSLNLVSEFTPNRPPYVNNSISWYDMQAMSDSLKTSYSCSYTKYMDWYGMKFDLTTDNILLKVVVSAEDSLAKSMTANANIPKFKNRIGEDHSYFAFIHDSSGNIDVNADYYICCSDIHIKEFCDANSLTFPYDYSDKSLRDKIWTWGVVFNRTTGEPTHVKAYERTFV